MKKGTDLGKDLEIIMKEGKLVPTEVTVRLLREAMQKSSNEKFLIDGFPRAIDQAETFEKNVKPPELVLFFDCPEVRASLKFLALIGRTFFIVIYHPNPLKVCVASRAHSILWLPKGKKACRSLLNVSRVSI